MVTRRAISSRHRKTVWISLSISFTSSQSLNWNMLLRRSFFPCSKIESQPSLSILSLLVLSHPPHIFSLTYLCRRITVGLLAFNAIVDRLVVRPQQLAELSPVNRISAFLPVLLCSILTFSCSGLIPQTLSQTLLLPQPWDINKGLP